jgi:hypothetical protein
LCYEYFSFIIITIIITIISPLLYYIFSGRPKDRHRHWKGVNFICIRAGLVVIVVGEFPRTHKRAFSVSIISLFILLPFTYI